MIKILVLIFVLINFLSSLEIELVGDTTKNYFFNNGRKVLKSIPEIKLLEPIENKVLKSMKSKVLKPINN